MAIKDEYLEKVIGQGDKYSRMLAEICAPTLSNRKEVEVIQGGMNGVAVLRIPSDKMVVVHSIGGDPRQNDLEKYSTSLVDRLVSGSAAFGVEPLAIADVIDCKEINKEVVSTIGKSLADRANYHNLSIMNGELAGLGKRVVVPANVSGTIVSLAKKGQFAPGTFTKGEITYAVFDPHGKPVYINSDGVGTKCEFNERSGIWENSLFDSAAMKVDDSVKKGAQVKVLSDVAETNKIAAMSREFLYSLLLGAKNLSDRFGFDYIIQNENVGERIQGYHPDAPSFNLSGSAVSVIDEELLRNPPRPKEEEYLIGIRGLPNPRSNGITDKRAAMVEMLGTGWHLTEIGKLFMNFLAEPSTIFYELFTDLRKEDLGTSFYHMSGGAYKGKLAAPLAKEGLFVKIENLFPTDFRELAIVGKRFNSAEIAYAKFPMGTEGFVTTSKPDDTLRHIRNYGYHLEGRVVGKLQKAENGRTGVELAGIKSSDGNNVYYSGKD